MRTNSSESLTAFAVRTLDRARPYRCWAIAVRRFFVLAFRVYSMHEQRSSCRSCTTVVGIVTGKDERLSKGRRTLDLCFVFRLLCSVAERRQSNIQRRAGSARRWCCCSTTRSHPRDTGISRHRVTLQVNCNVPCGVFRDARAADRWFGSTCAYLGGLIPTRKNFCGCSDQLHVSIPFA